MSDESRLDDVTIGCATPDVLPVAGAALAALLVTCAVVVWFVHRVRPW